MKRKKLFILMSETFLLTALFLGAGYFWYLQKIKPAETVIEVPQQTQEQPVQSQQRILDANILKRPRPAPVSMERLKSNGCVADGLLSEYNPDSQKFSELINRSNCYYLHRAVETWLAPPDFETISFEMDQINKKDVVYGMFLAEAINVRADYVNIDSGEQFDFRKMCRQGSENIWGEGTCKPDFGSQEYRNYLKYITEKAIDLGIQSFTFGQIYMQEASGKEYAPKIIGDMRDYAKRHNVDIVIGAQTGSIADAEYLKLFDYIEGGVGLNSAGNVENGPCLSTRGSCWALLWHPNFASKAKNVLLHLDWTGIPSDDLDIFARMNQQQRIQTLQNLYQKFNSGKTGFLMPFFGVLYKDNGGCHGPKKRFYSPDNSYTCQDENAINAILAGKKV